MTAGSTSDSGPRSPTDGSQPRENENSCTSISPTQNTGSDTASDGSDASTCRSHGDRTQVAATATAVPVTTATTSPAAAICRVGGRASATAVRTSCPLTKEVPRSPCSAAHSLVTYCTGSGWSRP